MMSPRETDIVSGEPDPKAAKRGFFTTLPGILAAVAGLITALATAAGVFIAARDSGTPADATNNLGNTTTSVVAEDYYTTDGSKPRLAPTCEGIFNLCLGDPIEAAISLFGGEDDRSEYGGTVWRQWTIGGSYITVSADQVGSIVSLAASTEPGSGFRLLLPGALTLGESTMGQVQIQRGEPDSQETFAAENSVFYQYIYCAGPNATMNVTFAYVVEVGPDDPGGFDSLYSKQLTSYSVDFGIPGADECVSQGG